MISTPTAEAGATGPGLRPRRPLTPTGRGGRRRWVRRIAWVVVAVGVLTLGASGGGWWWTNHHATAQATSAADTLESAWAGSTPSSSAPSEALPKGVVAVLRIPRFGKDWRMPVYDGTTTALLRKGVGKYSGSPEPGGVGNYAVAGHRTTWGAPFRKLDTLRVGDEILVRTAAGQKRYRVTVKGITGPTDVSVIAPDPEHPTSGHAVRALLTLTTCHPEFSARERLYVHAALETTA